MSVDWSEVRRQLPVFEERNYLATACLGPFPRAAYEMLQRYAESRALHNRGLDDWLAHISEVTELCGKMLSVGPERIALRDSATACQASVIGGLDPHGPRKRIVVSALDFHSSLHLYAGQATRGFEVVRVPPRPEAPGVSDLEAVVDAIDERTAVVALSLVSRYGALEDLRPVIEKARRVGAVSIVDAYQAVGVMPVDAEQLGADVIVAGTCKWLSGSTGCAFLYASAEFCESHPPAFPGWFAHANLDRFVHQKVFEDDFVPMRGAGRFQQGTPPIAPIYEAVAGLRLVDEVGVDRIRSRNQVLLDRLWCALTERGYRVMTERGRAVGSLCTPIKDPQAVVDRLAEARIDVDQRRHEVIRVAPHPCSTEEECDAFVEELQRISPPER